VRDLGLRTVLLPLLRRPRFGVELTRELRLRSKGRLQAGPGSIYPALRKLEGEGLARSWTMSGPRPGRGRPRRYYELTTRGFGEVHRLQDAVATAMGDLAALPVVPTADMAERVLRARDLSEAARRIRASLIDATPKA
jgi:PadR family transcriptional regulator PadR